MIFWQFLAIPGKSGQHHSYPRIDIREYDDKYEIVATVTGLSKDDVKVELVPEGNEQAIIISGEKKSSIEEKKANFLMKEIHSSSFCRGFIIPSQWNIDESKLTAIVADGLLTVTIPTKSK